MSKSETALKPAIAPFIGASIAFLASIVAITWESWLSLWQWWHAHGSSYSHGTVIVVLMGWLIYDHWGQLQNTQTKSRFQLPLALIVGLAASFIWTLGKLMSMDFLYWASLPVIAGCIFIAASDKQIRFHSIAPFIAFIFAVPVWEILVPFLQHLAVHAVRLGIGLTGIPAFIEGINVNIPGGRFVVEGGCSGVRYFLVSVAITSLWSYLYIPDIKKSAFLIIAGALISILTNWIRIYAIIIIGYETQMQSSLIHDHEFFGWILFAIALIPIMLLAMKLEKLALQMQPETDSRLKNQTPPHWNLKSFVAGLIVIGLLPVASQLIDHSIKDQKAPIPDALNISGLASDTLIQSSVFGGWQPDFAGIQEWHSLQAKTENLDILIGHIAHQSQNHELFSSQNQFSDPKSRIWQEKETDELVHISNIYGQSWVIKPFYRVVGEMTQGGLDGKRLQASSIFKFRNDAQLILLGYRCKDDCSEQETLLNTISDEDVQTWLNGVPSRI